MIYGDDLMDATKSGLQNTLRWKRDVVLQKLVNAQNYKDSLSHALAVQKEVSDMVALAAAYVARKEE